MKPIGKGNNSPFTAITKNKFEEMFCLLSFWIIDSACLLIGLHSKTHIQESFHF